MKGGVPSRSGVHLSDQVARIIDDMGYASSKVIITIIINQIFFFFLIVTRSEINNNNLIKIYII